MQNEPDNVQFDSVELDGVDSGFSGLPEERIETVSVREARKTDPSRAEDELSEASQIPGEREILTLEPAIKLNDSPVGNPLGDPLSPNLVGEPVLALPEPSPVKDPLSAGPGGLPNPDDPFGGNNKI